LIFIRLKEKKYLNLDTYDYPAWWKT
jgi:hypothetical protein